MMHRAWRGTEDAPYCFSIKFQGHSGRWSNLIKITICRSQLSNPSDLPRFHLSQTVLKQLLVDERRHLFIVALWRHTAAYMYIWVSVGWGNGLAPVWYQAITSSIIDLLSIWHLGTSFSENWTKMTNCFVQENALNCRLQNVGHLVQASNIWLLLCTVHITVTS